MKIETLQKLSGFSISKLSRLACIKESTLRKKIQRGTRIDETQSYRIDEVLLKDFNIQEVQSTDKGQEN